MGGGTSGAASEQQGAGGQARGAHSQRQQGAPEWGDGPTQEGGGGGLGRGCKGAYVHWGANNAICCLSTTTWEVGRHRRSKADLGGSPHARCCVLTISTGTAPGGSLESSVAMTATLMALRVGWDGEHHDLVVAEAALSWPP